MQARRCTLSWTLAAALLLTSESSLTAPPDRAARRQVIIQGGEISFVLRQLYDQTGVLPMTTIDVGDSSHQQLPGFDGHATIDEVLAALLGGTDLSYTWRDENEITIDRKHIDPPHAAGNVHEMTVTGSRLSFGNEPAPVRVYDEEDIGRSGASTLPELARHLTQQATSHSSASSVSGAQFFELRGLGVDTTLVLLNGRRMPPSASSLWLNGVDINNLPLTAVERVEVMSDSASAIYGADAIGGVVNIILKDRIDTPEITLHYGQAEGGGTQRRAAGAIGVVGERLKTTLVLDAFETDPLMGMKRDLWRNQDFRRYGGSDYRITAGNVYSLNGQPLPGLSSWHAAVPVGTSGLGLSPADFFATDGVTNLESSYSHWSITPQSSRASVYGSMELSLDAQHGVFGEALVTISDLTSLRGAPSLSRQVVPASNPFNPFGTAVAVDYSFEGMDPISYSYETETVRSVVGVRGTLGGWNGEIAWLVHNQTGLSTTQGALDAVKVADAINSTDRETALNFFSDGPAGSAALLESLKRPPQTFDFLYSSQQVSAFIRGAPLNLPKGPVEMVLGGEWRLDSAALSDFGQGIHADRKIASLFSEMRLPLLDSLIAKLAFRADHFGNDAAKVSPQYGLTWRPAKNLLLRASYGTSFRLPSLYELYMPTYEYVIPIADPHRGGSISAMAFAAGGNRDLEPISARSFTAGFVYDPASLRGLSLSGSYWRICMEDRILMPSYQDVLLMEHLWPERVMRGTPSASDIERGWPGPVQSIDATRLNYGGVQTSGIDLDAALRVDRFFGSVEFKLGVTWVDEFLSRDLNGALPLDRVGIANIQGTIPEWRTTGRLSFERNRFGASIGAVFVPAYQDADRSGVLDRNIHAQLLLDVQAWMKLELAGVAALDGSKLTLGATNGLNQMPGFANAGLSLGHDITQSELTGTFFYLRLGKWF